ncbi:helix-turn-helix domain-containing protein [Actinoplanes sp. NPDC051411]|uniref:helix-turn-helix domain-containing protein n=1 Tax=Actinoplanes sp. NPDC051411 TaxID=3155522 RepID=UPI003444B3C8
MDVVSTDEVPAGERFAYWRELNKKLLVPYDLRCDPRVESRFRVRAGFSGFGHVQVTLATMTPHSVHRTARLIRKADPEVWEVGCTVRGSSIITQDGRSSKLLVGDLVLVDTSRPYRVDQTDCQVLLLHFDRSRMPLAARDLRCLSGVRIPGDRSVGALTSQFMLHLARSLPGLTPAETGRLSVLTLEVLTTALAHALEREGLLPADTRQRALLARIDAFIRANLGERELNPEAIAAAHHISLRYLHRLFQQEARTVAGSIRELRLERCRRDLTDPRLASLPVHAIASRWGFGSAAYFSAAFRATYGVSPRQYREYAQM